MIKVETTRIAD